MNKRETNIKTARICFSTSAVLLALAGYFWYSAGTVGKTQTASALGAQCVKEFEVLGVKANLRLQDHAIVSYQADINLMQDRVESSSMGIARCAGYRLVEFCAGNGCAKPGIFFIMEPI